MPNLQTQVYEKMAMGQEGTISRLNPIVSLPMIAEGTNVVAGKFVFEGTNPEEQVVGASTETAEKTAVAGLAVFENMQANLNIANTLNINEGENVRLVKKGFAYVRPTTAAVKNQSVYMNPETGEIQTASSAPTDFIDTGWIVETGAVAGQVCEIYNI